LLSLNKYLKVSKLLVCLLLFKSSLSQNLIRNGSFESYNTPSNWNLWGGDFIGYYSNPPDTVMLDWGQYQTPDYYVAACPHNCASVPTNHVGFNYPKNGNTYVGIGLYEKGNETKEYVYQHLSQPLQTGKTYCLSFFVNRTERTEYAIKQIGAYFSTSLPSLVSSAYINANPQIVNTSGFISDTTQWTEIQGCFTALGGEQYIIIGNFNSNVNTDTLNLGTNNPIPSWPPTAYYYIDDINLYDPLTVGVKDMGNELGIMSVYPNPVKDVLNIDLGTVKENTVAKIYNALGELVLTEPLTNHNSSLNIHYLQNGIYFYHILVGEKNIKTDKIVIIK
jgi:hypothetical protein